MMPNEMRKTREYEADDQKNSCQEEKTKRHNRRYLTVVPFSNQQIEKISENKMKTCEPKVLTWREVLILRMYMHSQAIKLRKSNLSEFYKKFIQSAFPTEPFRLPAKNVMMSVSHSGESTSMKCLHKIVLGILICLCENLYNKITFFPEPLSIHEQGVTFHVMCCLLWAVVPLFSMEIKYGLRHILPREQRISPRLLHSNFGGISFILIFCLIFYSSFQFAHMEMLLSTAWNIILKVLKIKSWKTQTLEQSVKKCFTFQPNNSFVDRVKDECIEAFHLGVYIINPRSWSFSTDFFKWNAWSIQRLVIIVVCLLFSFMVSMPGVLGLNIAVCITGVLFVITMIGLTGLMFVVSKKEMTSLFELVKFNPYDFVSFRHWVSAAWYTARTCGVLFANIGLVSNTTNMFPETLTSFWYVGILNLLISFWFTWMSYSVQRHVVNSLTKTTYDILQMTRHLPFDFIEHYKNCIASFTIKIARRSQCLYEDKWIYNYGYFETLVTIYPLLRQDNTFQVILALFHLLLGIGGSFSIVRNCYTFVSTFQSFTSYRSKSQRHATYLFFFLLLPVVTLIFAIYPMRCSMTYCPNSTNMFYSFLLLLFHIGLPVVCFLQIICMFLILYKYQLIQNFSTFIFYLFWITFSIFHLLIILIIYLQFDVYILFPLISFLLIPFGFAYFGKKTYSKNLTALFVSDILFIKKLCYPQLNTISEQSILLYMISFWIKYGIFFWFLCIFCGVFTSPNNSQILTLPFISIIYCVLFLLFCLPILFLFFLPSPFLSCSLFLEGNDISFIKDSKTKTIIKKNHASSTSYCQTKRIPFFFWEEFSSTEVLWKRSLGKIT